MDYVAEEEHLATGWLDRQGELKKKLQEKEEKIAALVRLFF